MRPSAERYSTMRFWPSTYPRLRRPIAQGIEVGGVERRGICSNTPTRQTLPAAERAQRSATRPSRRRAVPMKFRRLMWSIGDFLPRDQSSLSQDAGQENPPWKRPELF